MDYFGLRLTERLAAQVGMAEMEVKVRPVPAREYIIRMAAMAVLVVRVEEAGKVETQQA